MSAVPSGVVAFDWGFFQGAFPELASSVTMQQAQGYFNRAALLCDNTSMSPICDSSVGGQRYTLLHLLTAHITALNAPLNGAPSSPLVGRVTNATEGSVSVQADMPNQPQAAAWYQQTKYGAEYWAATAQYRKFLYVRPHVRSTEPYPWLFQDPWNTGM